MKKLVVLIVTLALTLSMATALGETESYKIGFSFYNLSNPVWAAIVEGAVAYGNELGLDVSYVDCGNDAQKQIAQVENFVMSGCDAVVILPIDPVAIENVCEEAKAEGVHVLSYSTDFEGAETNLSLDPIANGYALVEMCKPWIDEHYPDGKFDWVFMDIPTIELGVREGNAVEEAMLLAYPESNLLGNAAVLTTEEGVSATENFMQAYPDCRVFLGISAGSGVGGNEAIKTAVPKEEWDDYGLFSVDATDQECEAIKNGEPLKGSIGNCGGPIHGRMMIDYCLQALAGEELERYYGMPIEQVTAANVDEYLASSR